MDNRVMSSAGASGAAAWYAFSHFGPAPAKISGNELMVFLGLCIVALVVLGIVAAIFLPPEK